MAAKSCTGHRMSTSFSSSRSSSGKPAASRRRASAWSAPRSLCKILKRCDFVGGYLSPEGKASARSTNSRASRSIRRAGAAGPPPAPAPPSEAPAPSSAKRSGSSRRASADMTAAAPVSSRHLAASRRVSTPPLAITGMPTARRTAAMAAQLGAHPAEPAGSRSAYLGLCLAVRPWTQSAAAPACSMASAASSVAASVSSSRIFAVTGTLCRPCARVPTILSTSGSRGRR
mmetsp:Transcript_86377/g.272571  ORF Transcript_86377/g.272571 Transcript_86377/m.272571 type:complete len:230 (+) Transcript_86377:246-935(+)